MTICWLGLGSSLASNPKLISGTLKCIAITNPRDREQYECSLTMTPSDFRTSGWSWLKSTCFGRWVCSLGDLSKTLEHLIIQRKNWSALIAETKPTRTRESVVIHDSYCICSPYESFACRAAVMRAGLLSSACGSISSGWRSRRRSANLLLRLSLGVIDRVPSLSVCVCVQNISCVCRWWRTRVYVRFVCFTATCTIPSFACPLFLLSGNVIFLPMYMFLKYVKPPEVHHLS